MADTLKLLYTTSANRCPSGTSLVALYNVGNGSPGITAMVSRIVIANITTSPATARVAILPPTVVVGSVLSEHYLAFDVSIAANDTYVLDIGGGIENNATVAVKTGTGSALVFNIFGIEVS